MFWLLPSSPSSIIPSGAHSLRPVVPIAAPGTAGAAAAAGAAPAAGAAAGVSAVAGTPIDAADPGAGPAPDPGGGLIQLVTASNPTENVPITSLVCVFIVVSA